jgi:hypothetical protein
MKNRLNYFPIYIGITYTITMLSCGRALPTNDDLKSEILDVESQFCDYVMRHGIAEGFAFFADDSATILCGRDSLIKWKNAIYHYYSDTQYKGAKVEWKPEFVQVSKCGDIAYTYTTHGRFQKQMPIHWLCKEYFIRFGSAIPMEPGSTFRINL